jgi:hypothetical protein
MGFQSARLDNIRIAQQTDKDPPRRDAGDVIFDPDGANDAIGL